MLNKNKNLIIRLLISLVLGLTVYYCWGNYIYLSTNLFSNIVTFLSILFGFYITSFSIFTTSRYVAKLYKIDDIEKKRSQSLMDTLIHEYKTGLIITLVSIIYTLVLFPILGSREFILLNSNKYLIIFLPFMLLNFIYAFEMMSVLVKVIKQTAKLNQD